MHICQIDNFWLAFEDDVNISFVGPKVASGNCIIDLELLANILNVGGERRLIGISGSLIWS